jgi:hypothetical protein
MKRLLAAYLVLLSITAAALGASGKQSAPPGSFEGAPPQYTRFSVTELERGFLALAFVVSASAPFRSAFADLTNRSGRG